MNIRGKIAAPAVIATVVAGSALMAAPANATVYNVSCPSGGVAVYSDSHPTFCYDWDGSFSNGGNIGWANISDVVEACGNAYYGYVLDTAEHRYFFGRYYGSNCAAIGHAWINRIVIQGYN